MEVSLHQETEKQIFKADSCFPIKKIFSTLVIKHNSLLSDLTLVHKFISQVSYTHCSTDSLLQSTLKLGVWSSG
jgi:hypothetical protein